eukprot:Pgem_evm1s6525
MKHTSEKGFTYSATVYADRNRQYFVRSNAYGTTDEGAPIKRKRYVNSSAGLGAGCDVKTITLPQVQLA